MKLITLRIPEDLLEIVNNAAQKYHNGDRSKMIREVLWGWAERQGDVDDKPVGQSDSQSG